MTNKKMNDKTEVLTLLMRRQRNRRIRNIILAIIFAGLLGWLLTYSQQQAFTVEPPPPGDPLNTKQTQPAE